MDALAAVETQRMGNGLLEFGRISWGKGALVLHGQTVEREQGGNKPRREKMAGCYLPATWPATSLGSPLRNNADGRWWVRQGLNL